MRIIPKVWITKYALTQGVYVVENAELCGDTNKMIAYRPGEYLQHVHKPHWHETEAEALKHAENMRKQRLASLKKQIEKLKSKKIKVNQ